MHEFRARLAQAKLLIVQGVDALKKQQLDEALTFFQKAIEQSPELPTGYYYLGVTWDRKQDDARAKEAYDKALQLKPDYAQVHSSLGLLYWRQNDPDSRPRRVSPGRHVRPRSTRSPLQFRLGFGAIRKAR